MNKTIKDTDGSLASSRLSSHFPLPDGYSVGSCTIHSHISRVSPVASDRRRQPCGARQGRLPRGTMRLFDCGAR